MNLILKICLYNIAYKNILEIIVINSYVKHIGGTYYMVMDIGLMIA